MYRLVVTNADVSMVAGWERHLNMAGLGTYLADGTVSAAKAKVPVDTGALKGSIRYDTVSSDSDSAVMEVSANTYYALYVEKGTSRMRAQPYLLPALRIGTIAGLKDWKPGASKPKKSGRTITAKEASRSRTEAVAKQARRDARATRTSGRP